jgi:hypothetical protein
MNMQGDYCEKCDLYFDWHVFQQMEPGFESRDYDFLFDSKEHLPLPPVRHVGADRAVAPNERSSSSSSSFSSSLSTSSSTGNGSTMTISQERVSFAPYSSATPPDGLSASSSHSAGYCSIPLPTPEPSHHFSHPPAGYTADSVVAEEGSRSSKTAHLLLRVRNLISV